MSARHDRSGVPLADDARIGLELPTITDEFMRERLPNARSYALVILRKTGTYERPKADPIVWEHGRRNMALVEAGVMPIVCPSRDESDFAGICILTVPAARAAEIYEADPGVKAGIFTFEVHPVGGFPGSALPEASTATARVSRMAKIGAE